MSPCVVYVLVEVEMCLRGGHHNVIVLFLEKIIILYVDQTSSKKDSMITNMNQNGGYSMEVNEESDEDTAGEGADTLPQESTTTDAYTDPIDFIETHPHDYAHHFNGAGVVGSGRNNILPSPPSALNYENWTSILAQMDETPRKGNYIIILIHLGSRGGALSKL